MHSEALGFDRAWYAERHLAWLVRAAQVEVRGPIPMGATIQVSTQVLGYRKVWARRRAEFALDGGLAASVITDWVLIDGRGRLTRLPAIFESRFPGTSILDAILRVDLPNPPADAAHSSFGVRRQELDPMVHVNNAVYLDWFEESVAERSGGRAAVDAIPRTYRLEYASSAEPDATVEAVTWRADAGWLHRQTAGSVVLLRARLDC